MLSNGQLTVLLSKMTLLLGATGLDMYGLLCDFSDSRTLFIVHARYFDLRASRAVQNHGNDMGHGIAVVFSTPP